MQYNFALEKVTVTQTSLENVQPNKSKGEMTRNLEIKVETKKANNRTPNRLQLKKIKTFLIPIEYPTISPPATADSLQQKLNQPSSLSIPNENKYFTLNLAERVMGSSKPPSTAITPNRGALIQRTKKMNYPNNFYATRVQKFFNKKIEKTQASIESPKSSIDSQL